MAVVKLERYEAGTVQAGLVVMAPSVEVRKINSGGVVITDSVIGLKKISSGGLLICDSHVNASTSSGGMHVRSLEEAIIAKGSHRTTSEKNLRKALNEPDQHSLRHGDEGKFASIGQALERAEARGLTLDTDLSY